MSATGRLPRCASCQSLERHRTLRAAYLKLRGRLALDRRSCLQISDDRCVEPSWFSAHAVSIYGSTHSLDIQALPMASGSFGCVICNHVLEHVPDDRRAMAELLRVTAEDGFLQIGVPDPARWTVTRDWGEPDWNDHGHFRIYGIDIVEKLTAILGDAAMLRVRETDPITGLSDLFFFLTRSASVAAAIRSVYPDAVVDAGPGWRADRAQPPQDRAPMLWASHRVRDPARLRAFALEGGGDAVVGGLTPAAMTALAAFDAFQRANGLAGHVCEIGVGRGRSFIAMSLLRCLGERSLSVVWADHGAPGALAAEIETWLGPDHDAAILAPGFPPPEAPGLVARLAGRARLVRVDGLRDCSAVLDALRLAQGVLAPGGLAILDGFLDSAAPGVAEAAIRYLDASDGPGGLVPVACGDGGLYLAFADIAARYRAFVGSDLSGLLDRVETAALCGRPLVAFAAPDAAVALRASALSDSLAAAPADGDGDGGGTPLRGPWAMVALDLPGAARAGIALRLRCRRDGGEAHPRITVHALGGQIAEADFPPGQDVREVVATVDPAALGPARRLELWLREDGPAPHAAGGAANRVFATLLGAARAMAEDRLASRDRDG
jgi:hypothetical protein